MEPPSRTTPNLDILFTPPVYKTYIFLQDFSSRDNLMLSVKADALRLSIMISFFILLAPSNTLVSLLYPRACIHLYRLLNQSIPEQQWALFNIGSQCPIKERNDGHVVIDPIRSVHMNIQQKFLCIAAYEGFVYNTKTEYIEQ